VRKLHLGIDAETMEIRALEVTPNSVGTTSTLPALLGLIDTEDTVINKAV
jgi:hypothetical protein